MSYCSHVERVDSVGLLRARAGARRSLPGSRSTVTWCRQGGGTVHADLADVLFSRTRSRADQRIQPAQVRAAASGNVFPSVDRLPSTASADGSSPSLFGGFPGSTRPSDFPRACMPGFRFVTFSGRPGAPSAPGAPGTSRFPRKEFPRMLRVSDCAGSSGGLPIAPPSVWPSALTHRVGTLSG